MRPKRSQLTLMSLSIFMGSKMLLLLAFLVWPSRLLAQPQTLLPPADDPPEEVLRTEIYTEARSAIDGEPLTAAEYIEQQEDLATQIENLPPEMLVSDEVREIIGLLKLRQLLKTFVPFF